MTTVTYRLERVGDFKHPLLPDSYDVSIVARLGGAYIPFLEDGFIQGRLADRGLTLNAAFPVGNTAGYNFDPEAAVLKSGTLVTVYGNYDDGTGESASFYVLNSGTGALLRAAAEVPADEAYSADVAALADGGFVITWTVQNGGSSDVQRRSFNADGSGRSGSSAYLNASTSINSDTASVAGLTNGGFAIAYSDQPVGGGLKQVRARLQDANSDFVGSTITVDDRGTRNDNAEILGLKDGGFAVVYDGDGWNVAAAGDIGLRLYNADGTARSGFIRVNSNDLVHDDGNTAGHQHNPTIAQLGDGHLVIAWAGGPAGQPDHIQGRVLDAQGHATTGVVALDSDPEGAHEPAVAALGFGGLGAIWDGGTGTFGGVLQLARTSVGTAAGETIAGDGLVDHMSGKGGNDKLRGGAGADVLKGGAGTDRTFAGKDDDRDIFVFGKGDSDAEHPDRVRQFDAHAKHEAVWDKIDLSGIDGDRHHKHDQKLRFVDGFEKAGKHQPDGEVTVKDAGKGVKVLVDTDGDQDTDMVIVVTLVSDLHRADFIL